MSVFTKLLLATAAVVSLVAPAFAIDYNSDSFILEERASEAMPRSRMRDTHWSNAYAMDQRPSNRMRQRAWTNYGDHSPSADFGAAQVNGGQ